MVSLDADIPAECDITGMAVPGSAPRWVPWLAAAAWAVTVGVVVVGLDSLRFYVEGTRPLAASAVLVMGLCLVAATWRRGEVSRWLRALALLAPVHLGILAGTGAIYLLRVSSPFLRRIHAGSMLVLALMLAAGCVVIALALALRTRAHRILRGGFFFGCGMLLTTGMLAPIVALFVSPESSRTVILVVTLGPALLVGALTAWTGLSSPLRFRRHAVLLASVVKLLALVGLGAMAKLDSAFSVRLAVHVPVLFGEAFFVLVMLGALAVEHLALLSGTHDEERGEPWRQEGTIVGHAAEGVAFATFHGWLGGVTTHCERFRLQTSRALLDVPRGARLAVAVPSWTTRAKAGEVRPVLSSGDRVTVTGFVTAPGNGPFRASGRPFAGSSGLCVATGEEPARWRDATLLVWGPSALYLTILVCIALVPLLGCILTR